MASKIIPAIGRDVTRGLSSIYPDDQRLTLNAAFDHSSMTSSPFPLYAVYVMDLLHTETQHMERVS
jgi:hypothetical protein